MITEYRPVTWTSGEPISSAKLTTMANNDQFLYESAPILQYTNGGIKKNKGIKILGITAMVAAQAVNWKTTTLYFGDFFSVGCRPIVAFGVNVGPSMRYHTVINGIGLRNPDHRGCVISVAADAASEKISHNIHLHIIAMGW